MPDEHNPYLYQRYEAGCGNALQLFREIRKNGDTGSAATVGRYIRQLHRGTTAPPPRRPVPKPRTATACVGVKVDQTEDHVVDVARRFIRSGTLCAVSHPGKRSGADVPKRSADRWCCDLRPAAILNGVLRNAFRA